MDRKHEIEPRQVKMGLTAALTEKKVLRCGDITIRLANGIQPMTVFEYELLVGEAWERHALFLETDFDSGLRFQEQLWREDPAAFEAIKFLSQPRPSAGGMWPQPWIVGWSHKNHCVRVSVCILPPPGSREEKVASLASAAAAQILRMMGQLADRGVANDDPVMEEAREAYRKAAGVIG